MIKKLCLFTSGFAFNRQIVLNHLENILPSDTELFLFTPKISRQYSSSRTKAVYANSSKYFSFLGLRRFCRENKIDRITNLGALPQEGLIMTLANIFSKRNAVFFQAGDPLESFKVSKGKYHIKSFFEMLLFFSLLLFPKRILFCSEELKDKYRKIFYCRKFESLPLPIETGLFAPKNKDKARKKLKLPLKKKIIIYVGRIEYLKGADILYDIIKLNPDKLFILIGKKDYALFQEKIPSNLILLPPKKQNELVDYYNSADLCIFPSRIESFGFVPREAMSCGLPVLVSNIENLDILTPAIKSKLDAEEMNEKINNFFNLSEKEKKKISEDSRKFITENYERNNLRNDFIQKLLT